VLQLKYTENCVVPFSPKCPTCRQSTSETSSNWGGGGTFGRLNPFLPEDGRRIQLRNVVILELYNSVDGQSPREQFYKVQDVVGKIVL
jgi:hypothetical protein